MNDNKIKLLLSWGGISIAIIIGFFGNQLLMGIVGAIAIIFRQGITSHETTPLEMFAESTYLKWFSVMYLMCVAILFIAFSERILDMEAPIIFMIVAFPFIIVFAKYELTVFGKL